MRRAIGILILCIGCSGDDATLHPVRGTVTRGGKPLTTGIVQFAHQTEANIRAVAEIAPDGTFQLMTLGRSGRRRGAVAGPYTATVTVTPSEPAVQAADLFTVEPRENVFAIELP